MPGCVIVVGDSRSRAVAVLSATLGQDDRAIDYTYGGAIIDYLVPGITASVSRCHSSYSHIPKHNIHCRHSRHMYSDREIMFYDHFSARSLLAKL